MSLDLPPHHLDEIWKKRIVADQTNSSFCTKETSPSHTMTYPLRTGHVCLRRACILLLRRPVPSPRAWRWARLPRFATCSVSSEWPHSMGPKQKSKKSFRGGRHADGRGFL